MRAALLASLLALSACSDGPVFEAACPRSQITGQMCRDAAGNCLCLDLAVDCDGWLLSSRPAVQCLGESCPPCPETKP